MWDKMAKYGVQRRKSAIAINQNAKRTWLLLPARLGNPPGGAYHRRVWWWEIPGYHTSVRDLCSDLQGTWETFVYAEASHIPRLWLENAVIIYLSNLRTPRQRQKKKLDVQTTSLQNFKTIKRRALHIDATPGRVRRIKQWKQEMQLGISKARKPLRMFKSDRSKKNKKQRNKKVAPMRVGSNTKNISLTTAISKGFSKRNDDVTCASK